MRDASKPANGSAKKSRLGRGLGSLLGGSSDLESEVAAVKELSHEKVEARQAEGKEALKAAADQRASQAAAPAATPVTSQKSVTTQSAVAATSGTTQKSAEVKQMTSQKSGNAQIPSGVTTQNVATASLPTQVNNQMTTQLTSQKSGAASVNSQAKLSTSVADAKSPSVQTNPQVSPQLSATAAAPVQQKPIDEQAQIWKIPIDRLVANTQQPRQTFSVDALRDLTASIKEHGILQPITARRLSERQFEIIAGERRFRAAQAAGLHEVPVILKAVTEQVSLELAIIENMQREDLNPMEEAEAIEHLMKAYNLTQALVGEKLGKDRSSVANSLRLMNLPRDVREMVRSTELSAGHAKVLLGAENPETMRALAKQVLAGGLSVRATERLVVKAKEDARARASGDSSTESKVPERVIAALTNEIQKLIGNKSRHRLRWRQGAS